MHSIVREEKSNKVYTVHTFKLVDTYCMSKTQVVIECQYK